MSDAIWDSYTLADPPELTTAKWEAKKNALKIIALENKLKTLDPDLVEWEEAAQVLFSAQERQKQLARDLWAQKWKQKATL